MLINRKITPSRIPLLLCEISIFLFSFFPSWILQESIFCLNQQGHICGIKQKEAHSPRSCCSKKSHSTEKSCCKTPTSIDKNSASSKECNCLHFSLPLKNYIPKENKESNSSPSLKFFLPLVLIKYYNTTFVPSLPNNLPSFGSPEPCSFFRTLILLI